MGTNKEFFIKLLNNFMERIFIAILVGELSPPCQKVERLKPALPPPPPQGWFSATVVLTCYCCFKNV